MLICAGLTLGLHLRSAPRSENAATARGVQIVQNGGYPELHVDGTPFFIHSAAFFYERIPRDLWEVSLERHRQIGMNTIDIYIPWNWHEPREGEFDFDGHSNPRRDLRGLLKIIAAKGFKLIARPGPVILNEWRHGGYPAWLLERPEFRMDQVDLLEGRYPPLSELNASNAEAAAQGWLENSTHMTYARRWLEAVARELAPYSSQRVLRLPEAADSKEEKTRKKEVEISGPLLFVQLDDDMALGRTNSAGANFWRYMDELRRMLESGGLDVPVFINPADMRVSAAGTGLDRPIGVMGQWYLRPRLTKETGEAALNAEDVSGLEFYVEELKTQPAFPPLFIEYQAGWYCPADDVRPLESAVANTLLSSRLLLAHGLHGLNYFPAQDTLSPAGYSVPWANRYYRWDAALDPDANQLPRARLIGRNGALVSFWGSFLAASHKRADFGVIYPLGAYPQEKLAAKDILSISRAVIQIERLAQLAGLSSELLDPQYQPAEQLLRHPLILLPVFDPERPEYLLSERAQQALAEYVRRGGTLVYAPNPPAGKILAQMRQSPGAPGTEGSAVAASWRFGDGRVIESSKDFYSWVQPSESFAANLAHPEAAWATKTLREFLDAAGIQPVVQRPSGEAGKAGDLLVTELVSDEGTGLLGERTGGQGLASITNLSNDQSEQSLEILSPRSRARGGRSYIPLRVSLPPRESFLMPLEYPLCSPSPGSPPCNDEIIAAGAELVRAEREGKTLELFFYTPARATVRLSLAEKPSHISVENASPEVVWHREQHELEVQLLRGASPSFRRLLKFDLPYKPDVPERPSEKEKKIKPEYDFTVANSVRLPLADDTSLHSEPPLVVVQGNTASLVLLGHSYANVARSLSFKLEGPINASGSLDFVPHGGSVHGFKLQSGRDAAALAGDDGLLHGQIEVRFADERQKLPIAFVPLAAGQAAAYQFDFDRDGSKEWVLEDDGLRLITSPESGGRLLALVDKPSGKSLTTSVGALRDHFSYTPNPPHISPQRARGRYGLFNRPYHAEWVKGESKPALRLTYDAPDVYPSGAAIEKTIALTGSNAFQVDYRIELHSPGPASSNSAGLEPAPQQSFLAVNSVAVSSHAASATRFCWSPPNSSASRASPPETPPAKPAMHCEQFTPARDPLQLPEGVAGLQVLTTGRPGLALEWEGAKMTIEMKGFSALLKLQFPALAPGGPAGRYRVRYRVVSALEAGAE